MRNAVIAFLIVFGAAALLHYSAPSALAATPGDSLPAASYGAVNVGVTATAVPASPSTRNTLAVQNRGPNSIFCGWDSSVTTATGFEVPAGAALGVDVTWDGQKQRPKLFCITTVLQVSPANTRYMEVK